MLVSLWVTFDFFKSMMRWRSLPDDFLFMSWPVMEFSHLVQVWHVWDEEDDCCQGTKGTQRCQQHQTCRASEESAVPFIFQTLLICEFFDKFVLSICFRFCSLDYFRRAITRKRFVQWSWLVHWLYWLLLWWLSHWHLLLVPLRLLLKVRVYQTWITLAFIAHNQLL